MCKTRSAIRAAALEAPCTRFITACMMFPPQDVRYMQKHEPEVFNFMVAYVNYWYEYDYHGDAARVIRHDTMDEALHEIGKRSSFLGKLIHRKGFLTGIYTVTW